MLAASAFFAAAEVWYLAYSEQGQRRQPRVGPDRYAAKQMAGEINGQLEVGCAERPGLRADFDP